MSEQLWADLWEPQWEPGSVLWGAVANGSKAVCLYLIGGCDELRIICIKAEAVVDIGGGSAVLDDAGGLGVGQSAGTEYGEYLCCIGDLALGVNSVVELEN